MQVYRRLCSLAGLLMLCLAACDSQPAGSVQFVASLQQALSASDITRVKVTVSAADMPARVVELAKSNASWGGLIGNLPAGSNRAFLAEAFDASGTLRFQGETSGVSITANQTSSVAITLQGVPAPPPYGNEVPVIGSLVASATSVQTGASLSLTATVHDPNAGDTLTLAWTGTGGAFSASAAATTSWTAPASPGAQTLTLTVTDSQGAAVSVSLAVNVISGAATGNAALDISFNLWPVVSRVSASLNRLDAGQSTTASALASDADGDALSYLWTATCPGSWTNAASSTASFVPASVPAGACNNCQLTVAVNDSRGGRTTGSLSLCVAAASLERFPPRFTNFYQSATATAPGQTVTFDVTAMDPQASSQTFAWAANTGSLATAQNTATTSHVVWTAPACAPSGTTPSITVTVTNAFNLTATQSFSVTGLPACASSGWASTRAMAVARHSHTATLLNNGTVLVAGGLSGSATVATAEVYDPATGTWAPTGPMAVARGLHTATLLKNGKVLVTGGNNGSAAVSTAEVYDPAAGTWSAAGLMSRGRESHTATLLNNGKVLVAGGREASLYLGTADVYDPDSGTWSATAPMSVARAFYTATLLNNGKVLVAAGYNGSAYPTTAEVYEPTSGTWSAAGVTASRHADHAAALLSDGRVLVTGGHGGAAGYLATADVYDPATNAWSTAAPMASARQLHTLTPLPNGKALVAGGRYDTNGFLAAAEVFDQASGTWRTVAPMASARRNHTATLLNNGKVLVSGGFNGSSLAAAELYTP